MTIGYLILAFQADNPIIRNMEPKNDFSVNPVSHASFVMRLGGLTIYNDPVGDGAKYADYGEPDLLLLGHEHPDHLDINTLTTVAGDKTVLVAPKIVYDKLPIELQEKTAQMGNGDIHEVGALTVMAVPMYNLPESPDTFHVKGVGNGYVLQSSSTKVYIAGDTEGIPEMFELGPVDYAFIPMNLPYTMSVEAAAAAVVTLAPKTVYPYHYRGTEGYSDVKKFAELVKASNPDIKVELLNWYPEENEIGE